MTPATGRRVLVVGQDFPWPATIGSHLRLAQVVDAAAQLGDVDLFCLAPARRTEPCQLPADVQVSRVATRTRPVPQDSLARRLRWALASRLPLDVERARFEDLTRDFRGWARESYDAAWFSKAATFELLGRPHLGPTAVDLDDLEDRKAVGRRDLPSLRPSGGRRWRDVAAGAQARLDARRWHRLQHEVAGEVEMVVLCSELDARRAGFPNAAVVPNGYPEPTVPLGRREVGRPPTVLFAGSTCYGPNADAARWLVSDIWPRLRAARPDAVLRLVGEPGSSTAMLGAAAGVTVVGQVESMEPELALADLVVVPLRYGSGTRVKILEAFAHRIPVVSTVVGAEGLGARHGEHLLVADDPTGFAEAGVALTSDTELRNRLVGRAHQLYREHYRSESVAGRVHSLLEDLTVGTANAGEPTGSVRR